MAEALARPGGAGAAHAALTVLAVDDDADVLRATERILLEAGFRVLTGTTAAEALELTRRHLPALVLLDVMLPDGDGVDVARQLKSDPALADVFVILLSGVKISSDDQAKGLAEGLADGYMVRPLRKPELLARIEAFLRIRAQNKELRCARLELEEQRAKYFELFDLAPVGYLALDDTGMVRDANRAAALLLDVGQQPLVGRPFSIFVFAADRDVYHRHMRSLREIGWAQTCELRLQPVGAEPFWGHLEWQPQRAADGEPLRYHLTITDVHERVVAQEASGRLNEVLEERVLARTAELAESEERLRRLFETMTEGVVLIAADGRIVSANPAAESILGLASAMIEGRVHDAPQRKLLRPDGTPLPATEMPGPRAMKEKRAVKDVVMGVVQPEGAVCWINASAAPLLDAAGELEGVVSVFTDITEHKRAEEELRENEERYRRLADNAPDIIFRYDLSPTAHLAYMSPAVEAITGHTPEELYTDPQVMLDIVDPQDIEQIRRAIKSPPLPDEPILMRWTCKGDVIRWMESRLLAVCDADGRLVAVEGITRDITARKQAEEEVRQRNQELARLNADLVDETAALAEANATITRVAATDDLTGLANRRHFYESLEKAVSLARRHGSPLAVLSLDLDGLNRVNDSAGHEAGDEVLTSFAALLAALCRAEDLPGRLGGDEFSVLLPGMELGGALGLAERLLAAVSSREALAQRGVTVSAGVAQWAPGGLPDDLLRRADQALYAAKRGGGNAAASGR